MSQKVPMPVFGKHTTSCVVYPGTVGSDGTITWGTGVPLASVASGQPVGKLMAIKFSNAAQRQEMNAMHTTRQNEIVESDAWNAEITIYKVNDGSDPNPLYTLFQGADGATPTDYIKIVWVSGTNAGSIQTHTFYGIRGEFSDGGEGRGAQNSTLSLGPVDVGAPQYGVVYS